VFLQCFSRESIGLGKLQCVANVCCSVRCSVLQCFAMRCSVQHCVAVIHFACCSVLQWALQRVATCFSPEGIGPGKLQCVAMCCSVCCSALHRIVLLCVLQ